MIRKRLNIAMSNYVDNESHTLVKDLMQSRNHHKMLVREIESKLKELSKKYELTITLDD